MPRRAFSGSRGEYAKGASLGHRRAAKRTVTKEAPAQHSMSGATEAAAQTGALVFELGGLWQRLSVLVDGRGRRGKRYPLAVVLMLMVLAKLSGQDRPSAIADWVRHRRGQLQAALGLRLARCRTATHIGVTWPGRSYLGNWMRWLVPSCQTAAKAQVIGHETPLHAGMRDVVQAAEDLPQRMLSPARSPHSSVSGRAQRTPTPTCLSHHLFLVLCARTSPG